jgi:hypothetical protein
MERVESYVQRAQGDVYLDRLPALALRKGETQHVIETALILDLWRDGKWDPTEMMNAVRDRQFSLMCVSQQSLLPPPVLEEIEKNYRVIDTVEIGTFEVSRRRWLHVMVPRES